MVYFKENLICSILIYTEFLKLLSFDIQEDPKRPFKVFTQWKKIPYFTEE